VFLVLYESVAFNLTLNIDINKNELKSTNNPNLNNILINQSKYYVLYYNFIGFFIHLELWYSC